MTPFMSSLYDLKNDALKHEKHCKQKIKRLKQMGEERHADEIVNLIIQAERSDAVAGAMSKLIEFLEKEELEESDDQNR